MKQAGSVFDFTVPFAQGLAHGNQSQNWYWFEGLVILAVVLLGSALWQASRRLRAENETFLPLLEPVYNWRRDSLFLTYLTLLTLFLSLTAFVAYGPVSKLTFWLGYAACGFGQLIPAGKRLGERIVQLIESVFSTRSPGPATTSRLPTPKRYAAR